MFKTCMAYGCGKTLTEGPGQEIPMCSKHWNMIPTDILYKVTDWPKRGDSIDANYFPDAILSVKILEYCKATRYRRNRKIEFQNKIRDKKDFVLTDEQVVAMVKNHFKDEVRWGIYAQ